ncbi:MAG TPA: ribonuclease T [Croceibacterium sp.]|nr:ribonuclease T [Croceibacterium sp.]
MIRSTIAALAFAMLPASALAQAYQCRIPQAAPSVPPVTRDGPVRQTAVSGYMLALSWSPEYCRGREGAAGDRLQCSGQGGRFGFIVHGLWPEGRGGQWPQWCPATRDPTPQEVARNLCMTPSAALLAHEWAKHGSCMVGRPEAYFRVTRILWNSLRWPDFDRLSRDRELTAGEVRRAFADANPYWEPEHVGLVLNARGWLEEMRLCYGKDFMPVRCDSRRFGPRDSAPVKIWRGL